MMAIVLTAARTALLLFSLLGYVHAAGKRLRAEFALGAVLVSIGAAMFLAGILNILQAAAWALCLGGALLAVRAIRRRESFRDMLCMGYLFFLGMGVVLIWVLYGAEFTVHDNFSHWAKITKLLLHEHRLPNFLNADLEHQSYPTGSGSFIYYMLTIAGTDAEWVQMYAQIMLSAAMSVSLFAFTDRLEMQGLTAAAAVTFFSCYVQFRSLCVDTLLPMIALGGMGLLLYYRDDLSDRLWWLAPYGVFLLAVKNSGLFFAAVLLLYGLVLIRKDRTALRRWLVCVLCAVLAQYLWQRHVAIVFEQGLSSRHAMTLSNFSAIFGARSPEEIRALLAAFAAKVFSPSDLALYPAAAQVLLCLLARFWLRRPCKPLLHCTCLVLAVYVVYMFSLLGMYLFNMPGSVAVELNGYDRYHATVLVFIDGILWIELLEQTALPSAPPMKRRTATAAFSLAFLALLYLSLGSPILHRFRRQDLTHPGDWQETARYAYDTLLDEYDVPSGETYIVVLADTPEAAYFRYMTEYLLSARRVTVYDTAALRENSALSEGYDYLIALDDTEEIRAYLADTFGDPSCRVVKLAHNDG